MTEHPGSAGFPSTHWSRVIAAGDPSGEALAELCRAYWFPVYAYIRRKGHDPDRSADLAQDFFARLIEKGTLAHADAAKGRFRAFLLADCAHFLADARDREAALKRGGGLRFIPLDAEGRYSAEPVDRLTPEKFFDQAWALSLLAEVIERLEAEFAAKGQSVAFEALKVVLTDGPRSVPLAEVARRLGSTEGSVQVALHRLRKRYKVLVRERIAETVADPSEVEDEIRALFVALS